MEGEDEKDVSGLRVVAQSDGRRRAGFVFGTTASVIAIAALTASAAIAIGDDPMLTAEPTDQAAADKLAELLAAGSVEAAPIGDMTIADALGERDRVATDLGIAEARIRELEAELGDASTAHDEGKAALIAAQRDLLAATERADKSAEAVDTLQADLVKVQRELAETKAALAKATKKPAGKAAPTSPSAG